jgi:hypothetical protein
MRSILRIYILLTKDKGEFGMSDIFIFYFVIILALVTYGIFLINDKVKVIKYRLEHQIEQNEKIIKLLSQNVEN